MGETLKKCPFCNGNAFLQGRFNYKQRSYFVCAKCNICGAQGKTYTSEEDPEEVDWNNSACNEAVTAWNMRYKEGAE